MNCVKIGNKLVGKGQPCFIVAEIGINHNGSLDIAKQLIDVAVEAGCDAVKFQKRDVETVYTPDELAKLREVDGSIIKNAMSRRVIESKARFVLPEANIRRLRKDPDNTTNGDLKYALEFGLKGYDIIERYCQERDILWFASCWDGLSAHFINGFNVPCHKIASACLTHKDLLERVRYKGKPVILSTGGSTMEQIEKAVKILGKDELVILHCTSNYPCPDNEINLRVMDALRDHFPGVPVGYSGHEPDIFPSVLAANMGACMVERHITLDKAMPGSDQKASLEPGELQEMVREIRSIEGYVNSPMICQEEMARMNVIRGDGVKCIFLSEKPVMKKLRRVADF